MIYRTIKKKVTDFTGLLSSMTFTKETVNKSKNMRRWYQLNERFIRCLIDNDLDVACVSGESNVMLYHGYILDLIREIAKKRKIQNGQDRLKIITGPILNVDNNNTSIIFDLFKENLATIYYSDHRQHSHYRIGGFHQIGNKKKRVTVSTENAHHILADAIEREPKMYRSERSKETQIVSKYMEEFLKTSSQCKKIESKDEFKQFIFLYRNDIKRLRKQIVAKGHKYLYRDKNSKTINHEYCMTILNDLGITPLSLKDLSPSQTQLGC